MYSNINFIFDRCQRSCAVVTPVKYGVDPMVLMYDFNQPHFDEMEKLRNTALVTPTQNNTSKSPGNCHTTVHCEEVTQTATKFKFFILLEIPTFS